MFKLDLEPKFVPTPKNFSTDWKENTLKNKPNSNNKKWQVKAIKNIISEKDLAPSIQQHHMVLYQNFIKYLNY